MSEANRALMEEFIEVVQNPPHDVDAMDRYFAPDFVNYDILPPFPKDLEGSKELHRRLFRGVPDMRTVVHKMAADGDKIWTYKTCSGTHWGELLGASATGRAIAWKVIDIMTIREGRIREHWGVSDIAGVLAQLRGPA